MQPNDSSNPYCNTGNHLREVRVPQSASHMQYNWTLVREKEMQRWEQQPFRDYTEGHAEHRVSTSCPSHYSFSLYLIQPKGSADKYETFQSKHMVNIYHSQKQRHSANLISSPILKFQKHSEIAQFLFTVFSPHCS